MHKVFTIMICLASIALYGQENINIKELSNVQFNENSSDIWGYVDEAGTEYAIIGTRTTTRVFSLEDPTNPIERYVVPGASSIWRDIKHFEDHLYITTDQGADGLLIIDMAKAPDTITHVFWQPELTVGNNTETLEKCHNLYIDAETGYCYLSGCNNSVGGIIILDLNQDKKNPTHVGEADLAYSHDVYTLGDRMYTSEIYAGELGVYDITDKSDPQLLATQRTTTNFTHNAWTSHDQNYVFTTDERANAYVDAYDISDLDNIQFLDKFQPLATAGEGVIPHNTHYHNGFLVTSWYTDGLVITDATKPDNLIEVGHYDTYLGPHGGFNGCWGAYPYLPSGLILVSDINTGLYVLEPVQGDTEQRGYVRACYLEGNITDANTGQPISGASVEILSEIINREESSDLGTYKTGQVLPGTFDVVVTHPNYNEATATVTLLPGEVTLMDFELSNSFINGTVIDQETGDPISGASVILENKELGAYIEITADDNGSFSSGLRGDINYDVFAGAWGYLHNGVEGYNVSVDGDMVEIELSKGYQDDFFADLGWTVSGDASSGYWELAPADDIFFGNQDEFQVQTSEDVDGDIGSLYYVTGATGTFAGADDIDNGSVILTSPMMDFTGNTQAEISYHLWFANIAGNTTPNDSMTVQLTNGESTIMLTNLKTPTLTWSEEINHVITDMDIPFTSTMQLIVTASDDAEQGHVVEAGIDAFKAVLSNTSSTFNFDEMGISIQLYPNPASHLIQVNTGSWDTKGKQYQILNQQGQLVKRGLISEDIQVISIQELPIGNYQMLISNQENLQGLLPFIKI